MAGLWNNSTEQAFGAVTTVTLVKLEPEPSCCEATVATGAWARLERCRLTSSGLSSGSEHVPDLGSFFSSVFVTWLPSAPSPLVASEDKVVTL